jgi:signal transduction histidine kinase
VSGSSPDTRMLRRVRWTLVAWSAIAVLVVLVILGAALYLAVSTTLAEDGKSQLVQRAQQIAESHEPLDQAALGYNFAQISGTVAVVIDPDGDVTGLPGGSGLPDGLPDMDSVVAARAGKQDVRILTVSVPVPGGTGSATQALPVRLVSQPTVRRGGTYVVQVIQDRVAEQQTLNVFLQVLAIGALLALTASLIAGAGYAGRALVPIREALRRQREFAADASHELRTPLTVVRGDVELLRRRINGDETSAGLLDDIDTEVSQLAALVDDLLLLARTDSGAVQLSTTPLDLADVALDAMPSLSGLAEARKVTLELEAAPAPILGDSVRLRQLVTILVDNAVRHTPAQGRVTIRVRPEANRSALEVIDDGPGVSADDLPHIFDRFWRSPSAPAGGTGLGLAIASWIVERHRGSITVDRAAGRGARFLVRLPADRGSAAPMPSDAVAPEPR